MVRQSIDPVVTTASCQAKRIRREQGRALVPRIFCVSSLLDMTLEFCDLPDLARARQVCKTLWPSTTWAALKQLASARLDVPYHLNGERRVRKLKSALESEAFCHSELDWLVDITPESIAKDWKFLLDHRASISLQSGTLLADWIAKHCYICSAPRAMDEDCAAAANCHYDLSHVCADCIKNNLERLDDVIADKVPKSVIEQGQYHQFYATSEDVGAGRVVAYLWLNDSTFLRSRAMALAEERAVSERAFLERRKVLEARALAERAEAARKQREAMELAKREEQRRRKNEQARKRRAEAKLKAEEADKLKAEVAKLKAQLEDLRRGVPAPPFDLTVDDDDE
jgi:hypothetical protein